MLVGRRQEMAAISQLLADARQGASAALVVRGEAGVGKSALLDNTVQEATGFTVLRGVGVEGEADLAYAALHQILRPAFDRIDRLPPPQAGALKAAFGMTDETVDERFRVSLGVLGLLSEAAEDRPAVCIVDDAQWLDQASADSLLFAARRLQAESVVLIFGARDVADRPFEARGIDEIRLSGLSTQDARQLVGGQLGGSVAADVVEWLVDNARGNPLALMELPATLTQQQLVGLDPIRGGSRRSDDGRAGVSRAGRAAARPTPDTSSCWRPPRRPAREAQSSGPRRRSAATSPTFSPLRRSA